MAPNSRVTEAFRSMKEIGISKEKVKPVLKKLLKLYDNNWELIEAENYRVLADAIFDEEDNEVSEPNKGKKCDEEDIEEEVPDELVRPLKRIRLKNQEGLASSSERNGSYNAAETFLKKPKLEEDELHPASFQHVSPQRASPGPVSPYHGGRNASPGPLSPRPASPAPVSPHHGARNASPGPLSPRPASPAPVSPHHGSRNASPGPLSPRLASPTPVSPHYTGRNIGKQTIEPKPLAVLERSGPNSHSSQMHVSYKGKEPMLPHVASNGKGPERVSTTLCIKDPAPEPVIPKKRVPDNTNALIIPKEEPFTDDMPEDEVPIAVIHPHSSYGRNLPIGDSSAGKSNWHADADEFVGAGASASMSERRTSYEPATAPDEIPSNMEIASSSLGEVKISLSYNSALGQPNFQLPNIDELRKLMEQRCLRSYKLIDPNFDVIKILNDMCECISELATNSSNQSQEGNVVPALDVLKKSPARDILDAKCNKKNDCLLARMLNGSLNVQYSANGCVDNLGGKELVVVLQHQLTPSELRWLHDASDITKGEENVTISWVNEINKNFPSPFQYISENLVFQNARVTFSLSRIGDENCCPTCVGDCLLSQQPCACACQAGGNFAYTPEGVVKEEFLEECISMTRDPQQQCLLNCAECPLEKSKRDDLPEPCKGHLKRKVIKECWNKCGCNKQCGNRVVQRGLSYKLQVFLTPDGKGWGLRTLEKLPKGAFVCEFVGEILTISELYARNLEKHTCAVLLDAYWGFKGACKDDEALCLDATCYGNVARFINHRCLDANLIEIPVEVETPDLHYYHLAFFTTREVDALEELTWDYGIDFDDLDHPVKAFRCRCGSKFCRNMKRSTRSKSSIITR